MPPSKKSSKKPSSNAKGRAKIPPEGIKYLRMVFHRYGEMHPDGSAKESILQQLQSQVPGTQHVTIRMLHRWFANERSSADGTNDTPSLTNTGKCDLEKWWRENPNPSKELITEWATQLDATCRDVNLFIEQKKLASQFSANPLDDVVPPVQPASTAELERSFLEKAIDQYNYFLETGSYPANHPPSEGNSGSCVGVGTALEMDSCGFNILNTDTGVLHNPSRELPADAEPSLRSLEQEPPSDPIASRLTLSLASIDLEEIEQIIANRAQRKALGSCEVTSGRAQEVHMSRKYPQTRQELDEMFKPYEEKIHKIMGSLGELDQLCSGLVESDKFR
ncbi:hypothetical protein K435DRAFT_282041 [Dendrothele bispora CBS 962.96]|uniref:Homeobox domain-containing protein n=1 Tax=Dendrothele bispora (strain CBS 962.96) TaxID=1314807 RepID=A0A4V4HE45_DENBC|nr:hypothetical protein K435DRAFT_282041 [Dendrothele bispora CBS 962.96]